MNKGSVCGTTMYTMTFDVWH